MNVANRCPTNFQVQLNLVYCGFTPGLKTQHPLPNIMINHTILQTTSEQKNQGLVFDSRLTWNDQVSNGCTKISYYLYLINVNKSVLPDKIIKLLLESSVMSHLNYALPVWGTSLTQQSITRI